MKTAAAVALFLAASLAVWAQGADVTYTEGDASARTAAGKVRDVQIGDALRVGDSVKTGGDGAVELDQKGVTLKVGPKTVFTLMERERGGQKTGVVSVSLGSLKMTYGKLTGKEPFIQTASCAAAVRGTELTVYAGADGSSLIAVDSGAVSVEAGGKSVDLDAGEGVEVKPGQPPGPKFKLPETRIDYSRWNQEKVDGMFADPSRAVSSVIDQMTFYIKSAEEQYTFFDQYNSRLAEERKKAMDILAAKGRDEAAQYQKEVVFPLESKAGGLYLNARYYVIGALSLRRYVAGRMYLLMKSHSLSAPADPAYRAFLTRYNDFLALFEQFVVPRLADTDI